MITNESNVAGREELIKALVKTQLEITPPVKDKVNPRFKTSYCSLDSIYLACRVPLAKNGLTLSHTVTTSDGKSSLVTTVHHVSGQSLDNTIPLFIENQTSQGFASALTYARRCAVCSILGLPTDDDDDGERATQEQAKPVPFVGLPDGQIEEIFNLIGDDHSLAGRITRGYGVTDFRMIPAQEFPKIVKNLQNRVKS